MKERTKGFIMGALVMALLMGVSVFAEQATKVIDAVYMNVKLVVDGVQIEPKDANGNIVEPFIYSGTTYLPVRAVGQAFNKEVTWDGDTATVYIGGKVDKAAKELFLYDRSYIANTYPNRFITQDNKNGTYDVGFGRIYPGDVGADHSSQNGNRYTAWSSVTYPLNGVATTIKGTIQPPEKGTGDEEFKVYIKNESGKVLYESALLIPSTKPIDFEVDVKGCLSAEVEYRVTSSVSGGAWSSITGFRAIIRDLTVTTTDY